MVPSHPVVTAYFDLVQGKKLHGSDFCTMRAMKAQKAAEDSQNNNEKTLKGLLCYRHSWLSFPYLEITYLSIYYISLFASRLSFCFCVESFECSFNRLFIGPSLGGTLAEHFGFAWALTVCKFIIQLCFVEYK